MLANFFGYFFLDIFFGYFFLDTHPSPYTYVVI